MARWKNINGVLQKIAGSVRIDQVLNKLSRNAISNKAVSEKFEELQNKYVELAVATGNGTTVQYKTMLDSLWSALNELDLSKVKHLELNLESIEGTKFVMSFERTYNTVFYFSSTHIGVNLSDVVGVAISNGTSYAGYVRSTASGNTYVDQKASVAMVKIAVMCEYI